MTGTGTVTDPYIISTVDDLQAIENDLTAYYELGGDIDASATVTWNGGEGFVPLAPGGTFTGQLDGKDYTVTSLFITAAGGNNALFYSNTGTIKNLTLASTTFTGGRLGGIAYINALGGVITDCHISGTADCTTGAAGFCYSNYGSISKCSSNVAVTGDGGTDDGGGFVYYNYSTGTIDQCSSIGAVSAVDDSGGFAYFNDGSITNSYEMGSVTGNGLAGSYAAGFIFYNNTTGVVDDCYSAGAVSGAVGGNKGFSNFNTGTMTNCFWDTETSGQTTDGGAATGKTTAQMKTRATFTDAGWNFTTIWNIDGVTNNGYPYLTGGARVFPINPLLRVSGIVRTFWSGLGGKGVYQTVLTLGGISTTYVSPISDREPPSAVTPTPLPSGPGYQEADYKRWLTSFYMEQMLTGSFSMVAPMSYPQWVRWKAGGSK